MDALLISILSASAASHTISFSPIFAGIPVLQLNETVEVWGNTSAPAGSKVQVTLDGAVVASTTVAGECDFGGNAWSATLPAVATRSWSRRLAAFTVGGASTSALSVMYGEVLLCSGQSNMQMPVNAVQEGGFAASNGTAESNAAGRYTNKIKLLTLQVPFPRPTLRPWNGSNCGTPNAPKADPSCVDVPMWNDALPGPNGTVHGFSALCWYSAKNLFEGLGGDTPVGAIVGSVGGSAIEFWLPPGDVNTSAACGVDVPPCDTGGVKNISDSQFFERLIAPLAPYTVGSMVWDQGERDVHCFPPAAPHIGRYACLEKRLITSWRAAFKSDFVFTAVQLPGYIGDCDGNGASPFSQCVPGVYKMRLAQDVGTTGVANAEVAVTYDLSCPFGVKTALCPFGSVHNVGAKAVSGARVAAQLRRMRNAGPAPPTVTEGPRITRVVIERLIIETKHIDTVTVHFNGGATPFALRPTENCAVCCGAAGGAVGDFDVSRDGGATWVNGSIATLVPPSAVSFTVPNPNPNAVSFTVASVSDGGVETGAAQVTHVRYTANQGFPQCAVVNGEGLPAYPFNYATSAALAFR